MRNDVNAVAMIGRATEIQEQTWNVGHQRRPTKKEWISRSTSEDLPIGECSPGLDRCGILGVGRRPRPQEAAREETRNEQIVVSDHT